MASLLSKTPCEGLLPVAVGTVALSERLPAAITSFELAASGDRAAFREATGAAFPGPNRSTGKDGARAVWMGPDLCFWLGEAPAAPAGFARTDQSDAWAVMRLQGEDAPEVLSRLVAVDLRAGVFKRGHTARTPLGHMSASITRVAANAFDIMVFRSMARTAVHELTVAMQSVAARRDLAGD